MPLYENRQNAENKISVPESLRESVCIGTRASVERLFEAFEGKRQALGHPLRVAFDGWYGIEWAQILSALNEADEGGIIGQAIPSASLFLPEEAIADYKKTYLTDDPGFGYVNDEGRVEEIMDPQKIWETRQLLAARRTGVLIYGPGAAVKSLVDEFDMIVYFDKTRQPVLWQMWDKKLTPFGRVEPDPEYGWKEYYYSDYHMLDHQKDFLYDKMDFWVEAIDPGNLKLIGGKAFDEIVGRLLDYPIKEIKIYQPGPWGAYRYKDFWDVPGLECNAWNELAGPELGVLVDLGQGVRFEMPMLNVMRYQARFLGERLASAYPRLFPMDVWLDDGYFPEPAPIERTAMPIHNHPSTGYVRRHFNEPLGRYETYYICEAYEGACTLMGYREDADLEAWEEKCRLSENNTEIKGWRDDICVWNSNVGDLYLIPPGTAHGHGGNQMVLEMDTCPSIAATEYSFFEYDFARPSWDDKAKTMTARPMRMHTEHAFDNERWRREHWVKDHLLAKPIVQKWTKDYQFDRYATLPEMPFEVERARFYTRATLNTAGRFAHVITLTIGKGAVIKSLKNPELSCGIDLFQSAIVPASFGEYEIISPEGSFCEAVCLRWKDEAPLR